MVGTWCRVLVRWSLFAGKENGEEKWDRSLGVGTSGTARLQEQLLSLERPEKKRTAVTAHF